MINQSLDVSKLGYRWTGIYNSSRTYVNGDIAFKDGYAKAFVNSSWTDIGIDQRDLQSTELLVKDRGTGGIPGQQLTISAGTINFDTPALRSGTLGSSSCFH